PRPNARACCRRICSTASSRIRSGWIRRRIFGRSRSFSALSLRVKAAIHGRTFHKSIYMDVTHQLDAQEFSTEVEGYRAELQYRLRDGVMTIVHTGVPDEIGGRGVAAELTRVALETARANGWKVVPACAYAEAFIRRHREYQDLLV